MEEYLFFALCFVFFLSAEAGGNSGISGLASDSSYYDPIWGVNIFMCL